MRHITIGTRASKLAMAQTYQVIERLQRKWPNLQVSIEQIRTVGDMVTDVPLSQIGGEGVFVTEIERALHEKRIDLAVHSLKDLPTVQPQGLCLQVVGPREDVRDVFVLNEQVRDGVLRGETPERQEELRIGTGSLRRTAQLRAIYPNAHILPIRGNVETRLRKLDAHEYDGIVLAAAGLSRLGVLDRLADRVIYFPIEKMMPAPGQGALAVEMRDEAELRELVLPLNDVHIQAATGAERMFMQQLGAGCYLPVAAYAKVVGEILTLWGLVISLDGKRRVWVEQSIRWTAEIQRYCLAEAEQLGRKAAEQALHQGAYEIISELAGGRWQEHEHV